MQDNAHLHTRNLSELLDQSFPERETLLSPWLTEKHLSMLYAPSGVGKSLFALALGLAVAGGGYYMDWHAPKPRRVLYVDGEMDIEDLQERAKLLIEFSRADRKEAGQNLEFLARQDQKPGTDFPDLATEEGRDMIMREAENKQPALLIFDNFSTLATVENENEAASFDPIIDLMQQLKPYRAASILVHHARKNANGRGSYRGTSKMEAIFSSIIALNFPGGVESGGGAEFDLSFEKSRGLRQPGTERRRVELSGDGWQFEALDFDKAGKAVRLIQTLKWLLCTYIRQKRMTTADKPVLIQVPTPELKELGHGSSHPIEDSWSTRAMCQACGLG